MFFNQRHLQEEGDNRVKYWDFIFFIKSKKMRKSHTYLSVSLSGSFDFLSAWNQIYLN